jgi:hypothetical protein
MEHRAHVRSAAVLIASVIFIYINRTYHSASFKEFIYKESIFYLLLPLIVALIIGYSPKAVGITLGDRKKAFRYIWMLFIAAVPFMIVGSRMDAFQQYYPRFHYGNWAEFAAWELRVGLLMLATEFFYRGFLMMGTKESIGRWSILLQAIPYAYVHLGKPMLEVYYSFFAGIAFGYVDYESRSIFPSFFLHWTTSIIFDILCTL